MRGALLLLSALALAGCSGPAEETHEQTSRLIVMVGSDTPGLSAGGPDDALFERHYADRPLALALPAIAEPWVQAGHSGFAIVAEDPPGVLQQLPLLLDAFVDATDLDDRERLARLAELLESTRRPFLGYVRLRRVDERLWDVLRAADAEGSTLTIVTRERARFGDVAEASIRVPLLVRFPAGRRPETVPPRVTRPTSHVELALSLRDTGSRLLAGEWPEQVFLADDRARIVIEERLKLVEMQDSVALYDVLADPGEQRDLAAERPEDAARLRGLAADVFATDSGDLDPAARERLEELRALGYIQ